MSNVTLKIGGRDYTVACAEGEEGHVRALGAMIADKVAEMGSSAQGETRQLLFAALLVGGTLLALVGLAGLLRGAAGRDDVSPPAPQDVGHAGHDERARAELSAGQGI